MKRALAFLLALAMLLGCTQGIFVQKASADDSESLNFYYYIEDGEAIISGYNFDGPEDVVIPATLEGCPVTAVGEYAFYYTYVKTVTIPDSVREIRDYAFGKSTLETLYVGAGVQSINKYAFNNCENLTGIYVSEDNAYYASDAAGALYNKDMTLLISVPWAEEGRFTVPSTVKEIDVNAFIGCGRLLDVVLPEGLQTIGDYAFQACSFLTQIEIPTTVTSLGEYVFEACSRLKDIYYPGTQAQWEQIANNEENPEFENITIHYGQKAPEVSLEVTPELCYTYVVENGEAYIESYNDRFYKDVVIPETLGGYPVVAIGEGAFYYKDITSVVIPDTVKTIGVVAFSNCESLRSVDMGNGVEIIEERAFSECPELENLTLSNRLTQIGECAFNYCVKLTEIDLPDSLEKLGDGAFWQCHGLTEITIPAGVTSIGSGICKSCDALTAITVDPANTAYFSDAYGILYNKDKTVLMEAPSKVTGVVTVPATVTEIADYAFIYCDDLIGIKLPEGLLSIGRDAFFECGALEEIRLPDSLQTLGDGALSFCYALTTVDFGEGIDSIGESAFNYVEELTSVVIGSNVKSIGKYAFYDCDKLTDVYYTGTEAQWNEISIGKYNDPLKNATIHYEWVRPAVPEKPDTPSSGTAGDLDGVDGVNEDDVIHLLKHLLMPEEFPVNQVVDYDQNNVLNEDDVIYLLQHLLMPEEFPLPESGETVTAVKILTKIWDAIPEEEKFFAIGGDMENMIDGAPGACALDPEYLTAILRVPADQVDKVTEAASLVHGMNASYFTCGAFRVTGDPAVFAEAMRDSIAGNPRRSVTADKQYVAVIDDYVVACFGTGAAMDPFEDAVEDTHPDADVIYNEQITPDNPGGGDSGDERPAEKVKLSIGLPVNAYVLDYDNNALTKWIEETCNVELSFIQYGAGSDMGTQISTTISAGQELPDIIYGASLGDAVINRYGQDGYFIDLSSYYNNKTASKHFWNRMENELSEKDQQAVLNKITDPDYGGMYSVPTVQSSATANTPYQAWINQQWLDALGLQKPTNMSELYDVLCAFRDRDPNGNGVKDEIPMIGMQNGVNGRVVDWLINMFCYYDRTNPYTVDRNGKLTPVFTSDSYRQALTFVARLVKDGLLNNISFTMTGSMAKMLYTPSSGTALCGIFFGNLDAHTTYGSDVLYQYEPLKTWGYAVNNGVTVKAETVITDDCDDPDRAFMVLMKLWSLEGSLRVRYGEYGVNWTDADQGAKSAYGLDATYKLLSDPLYQQHCATWGKVASTFNAYSEGESAQTSADLTEWEAWKNQLNAQAYKNQLDVEQNLNPQVTCPVLYFTEDESWDVDSIRSQVMNTVSRKQADFCNGSVDINNEANWNAYIAELEELGLEEMMTFVQTAYDRQK